MTSLENRQKTSLMTHCAVILIRRTNDKQKYEKDCMVANKCDCLFFLQGWISGRTEWKVIKSISPHTTSGK